MRRLHYIFGERRIFRAAYKMYSYNNTQRKMHSDQQTHYDTLKVSPDASDLEIKAAYHRLAMIFHPDRNPDKREQAEKYFIRINEAYSCLKDKKARHAYNHEIKKSRAKAKLQAHNDNSNNGLFSHIAEIFWPQRSR